MAAIKSVFGFNFMLSSLSSRHVELGADLLSSGKGYFVAGYKWILTENRELRPHLKGGLSLYIDPKLSLGNIVAWNHYCAHFGLGIEDLIHHPMSIRFDLEGRIGAEVMEGMVVMGYSWAW
jgi:hypothetical protein